MFLILQLQTAAFSKWDGAEQRKDGEPLLGHLILPATPLATKHQASLATWGQNW